MVTIYLDDDAGLRLRSAAKATCPVAVVSPSALEAASATRGASTRAAAIAANSKRLRETVVLMSLSISKRLVRVIPM